MNLDLPTDRDTLDCSILLPPVYSPVTPLEGSCHLNASLRDRLPRISTYYHHYIPESSLESTGMRRSHRDQSSPRACSD